MGTGQSEKNKTKHNKTIQCAVVIKALLKMSRILFLEDCVVLAKWLPSHIYIAVGGWDGEWVQEQSKTAMGQCLNSLIAIFIVLAYCLQCHHISLPM